MLKSIRGVVSIQVTSGDLYRFINAVRDEHIVCTSQKCRDGIFYADVFGSDLKRVQAIAEELGAELKAVRKKGLRFKAYAYRFRVGLIIGLIGVLCLVFYFSNTVITIEVNGNSTVTEKQVLTALSEMGVDKGAFIPDINFYNCEQQMRLSIPELSWVGIRHTGSRIVVDVEEAVEQPQMVNDDIPCNIVASRDAQIVQIQVYMGRQVKQRWDGVKKGDPIISGIVEDGAGHILKKHAMGKVRGIYYDRQVFVQPFDEQSQEYTGECDKRKYLDFFGLNIPLTFSDGDYDAYDYSESENRFSFFGIELPLGIVHAEYKPLEYREVSYTIEQAEDILRQKTAIYEKNFLSNNDIIILDRKITKLTEKDRIEYHVEYKVEGDIAQDSEIYIN